MSRLTFGFDEALSRMQKFPERLTAVTEDWVKDCALIVERKTKENIAVGREDWPPVKAASRRARVAKASRRRFEPLFDTGAMMRSVDHLIEKQGTETRGLVGWGVRYGIYHEKGAEKTNLPARPHMVPALEENVESMKRALVERVRNAW